MNETKEKIKKFLAERGWNTADPADVAKSIIIESAELLELFQWDNSRATHEITPEKLENIRKELADILIYCFNMGIILDLDMEKIIEEKLALADKKYPTDLFNEENASHENTNKMYGDIKQSYRKE